MNGPRPLSSPGHLAPHHRVDAPAGPGNLASLPLGASDPDLIAHYLLGILRLPNMHPEARDLALAKCIRARDWATGAAGGTVRNIMYAQAARDAGLLGESVWHTHKAVRKLLQGRHYLAIAHGEGPGAHLRLVLQRPHEFFPRVLLWEPGGATVELHRTSAELLFGSPDDRIILGPHIRYQQRSLRAGPMYHEVQSGLDCGIHAINALVGEQLISKAQGQELLMQSALSAYQRSGLTENDFFLNTPRAPRLSELYDIDIGIDPVMVESLLRTHTPFAVERSPLGADRDSLLTLVQQWQEQKTGLIVLLDNHYVTFKKGYNPRNRETEWVFIDSAEREQARLTPLAYLRGHPDLSRCVLFGSTVPIPSEDYPSCCNIQ